jgi:hypothetical protein
VNTALYEARKAELAADDGMGGPAGDEDTGDTADADPDGDSGDDTGAPPPTDADGDGHAAEAAGGDDCDDADPAVYPGADESWELGFTDADCDGAVEGGRGEYGAVAWEGWVEGDLLGRRVAVLGDMDGDGRDEALIASDYGSSLGAYTGMIVAVAGSPGGSLEGARALRASEPGGSFALTLDAGVDATGDGVDDLVVNASGDSDSEGAAWLVDGAGWWASSDSDVEAVAAGKVRGSAVGTYGPNSVAFVGDVDGDGVADVALSECCAEVGGDATRGRVAIVSTDAFEGRFSDAAVIVDGPFGGAYIGGNVAAVGDQDGDGLEDVALGATGGLAGAVVPGNQSGPLAEVAILLVYGNVSTGYSEAHAAGDLDGDGRDDLAILGDDAARSLYVFTALGGAPTRELALPSFTLTFEEEGGVREVQPLGDRDGDGRGELFVPQYYATSGVHRAWVLPGEAVRFGETISAATLALELVNVTPGSGAGASVALAPDIDGDRREDILIGLPSQSSGAHRAGGATIVPVPR